jgi:hypothetical protein
VGVISLLKRRQLVQKPLEGWWRDAAVNVASKHVSDPVVLDVEQYWSRVELIDHTRVSAGAQRISLGAEFYKRIRIGGAGF